MGWNHVAWCAAALVLAASAPATAARHAGDLGLDAPTLAARWSLAQAEPSSPPPVAIPDWREPLLTERALLEQSQPDLRMPIIVLAAGETVFIGGAGVIYYWMLALAMNPYSSISSSVELPLAGLVLAAVGVAALVVGGVQLGRAIYTRIRNTRRMNAIDEQLEAVPAPGGFSASRHLRRADVVLATF